jgi:GDP-L-fucose synthase
MSTKKVLVCGATGFIGRNIAEHYADLPDHEVYGTHFKREPFSHPKIRWIKADLTDATQVDRVLQGMDVVIQAAATTSGSKDIVSRPHIHVTDNAVMNSFIFRSAFQHAVKHVVFFSCSIMYQSNSERLKETDFDANEELHKNYFGAGWTKVYLEKMAEFFSRIGETKFTVFRHTNVYGPHDKYDLERSHVFGATVAKVMAATDNKITVWGTGEEERDLIYVSDLVNAVECSIDNQKSKYELLNIGYGESVSINELVEKIIHHSGKRLRIEHDISKPTIKTTLCLDCSRAREAIGWERKVTLDEGISKTLNWHKAWFASQ